MVYILVLTSVIRSAKSIHLGTVLNDGSFMLDQAMSVHCFSSPQALFV